MSARSWVRTRSARSAPRTVDVWSAALDPPAPSASLLRDYLSPDESRRAGRFVRDRDHDRFVAGRAFLRLLLGQCLGEDPRALVFRYGSVSDADRYAAADGGRRVRHAADHRCACRQIAFEGRDLATGSNGDN